MSMIAIASSVSSPYPPELNDGLNEANELMVSVHDLMANADSRKRQTITTMATIQPRDFCGWAAGA